MVRLLALVLGMLIAGSAAHTQTSQPLPDPEPFFAAVRDTLIRSQQEQRRYSYKERRTELRLNPFGRMGTGPTRVHEFIPTADPRVFYRRLLEEDGKELSNSPFERLQRRSRPPSRSAFEDAISVLSFTIDRRETVAGRPAIVVKFSPRPDARPRTREGRLARAFTGYVWVDEQAQEVIRAEGTATDDLSFGYGLIARLGEGTTVTMVRKQVDGDLWLPVSVRFIGEGRALLFRRLNVDYVVEWFDYEKASGTQ